MTETLYSKTLAALQCCDIQEKCQRTRDIQTQWLAGDLSKEDDQPVQPIGEAGRPAHPVLVDPRKVPSRNVATPVGRVILAHALAHIEFNAVNLALDAVYRFRDMPDAYYSDWLKVAAEEAYHFELLNSYLEQQGHFYGEYAAHNGLWEMAQKTAHDVLVRMALVPRVLEARGLDVTPGIIAKLKACDDETFVAHLEIIHRDEIGHVAIGSRWFRYVCEQRGLAPRETFKQLIVDYMNGRINGPFDVITRQEAGFTEQEIEDLQALEL